jgi:5-methylthioadenosine/S-adenosylhomocysteine deaminase
MIYEAEWVLPITSPAIKHGAVLVDGGAIVDFGPAVDVRKRHPEEPVTEFHHAILMPGFVNAHVHLEYSVFRGLFDDCGFGDWMLQFMTSKRRLEPSDYAASAMVGAMECVGSGITSIADTVFDGEATMRAANRFGLRAFAFVETFGMDDTKIDRVLKLAEERLGHLREIAGPLAKIGISPHAPYTVSGRLYQALAEFAREHGYKVATHLAESQAETTFIRDGSGVLAHDFRELVGWDELPLTPTGTSPIKYLEQWDAFDEDVIAIHCVQASPSDIEVLKRYNVAVAHCPKSNAKLGCGIAPVGEFLSAGLRVGLGTDSLATNNILDMFDEMRMALLLHRASQASAICMTAEQVLEMATLGGARVLGSDRLVGSIEVGKRADLTAVDMEYSHFAPIDDPVSALVYGANQEDVFFVVIDGKVVYDKKVFPSIDVEEISREADWVRGKLRA